MQIQGLWTPCQPPSSCPYQVPTQRPCWWSWWEWSNIFNVNPNTGPIVIRFYLFDHVCDIYEQTNPIFTHINQTQLKNVWHFCLSTSTLTIANIILLSRGNTNCFVKLCLQFVFSLSHIFVGFIFFCYIFGTIYLVCPTIFLTHRYIFEPKFYIFGPQI